MRAGTLRHRITIEAATVANVYGEEVETWSAIAEVFAAREDLSGREFFAAQQTNAEVTTRFRVRYIDGVTAKMRVYSDGVPYDIESVQDPDGRRRELILLTVRKS
jgi:SPP1 family predicted phage head-tail adaptor